MMSSDVNISNENNNINIQPDSIEEYIDIDTVIEIADIGTQNIYEDVNIGNENNNINIQPDSIDTVIEIADIGTQNIYEKDHSKLENLDYKNSGHTGFASSKDIEDINNELFNKANKEDIPDTKDFVVDSNYVHTDNNYTDGDKKKLEGIEDNANNYVLPEDVVQDPNYVHTDFNFTQAYKNKINNILPLIPQTRISQLVEDGVKYLKIDWDTNNLINNYQYKGKVKLFLYKYTKTGKKRWINQQTGEERYKTSVKKWVHPSNEYYPNSPAKQCWGIRSFQANPTFVDDIDEIIENSEYPIANDGLVQTEYIISAGQNSLKIPLNDIVSPILKVENTGTAQVVLPKLGDKRNVKLMGVKQKPAGSRCNQPIKFCLAVEDDVGHICIGSCLNVATIQLFKYRTGMNNHSGHGYSNGYSVLPDVGYSVFIK